VPAPASSADAHESGPVQHWFLGVDAAKPGTSGNDYFDGATTMAGGAGDDTYVVHNATDAITEAANGGTDTVSSFVSYALPDNVENLTLLASPAVNATGNALANVIHGNNNANVIDGGGGHDLLFGGGGADLFVFRSADAAGSHVGDFTAGSDQLDLQPFLQSVGYAGADPFADGTLQLVANADGTDLAYAGEGGAPVVLVTLDHVAPSSLHPADFLH
jgi:Ca2+-binding RTX toxin-like protein